MREHDGFEGVCVTEPELELTNVVIVKKHSRNLPITKTKIRRMNMKANIKNSNKKFRLTKPVTRYKVISRPLWNGGRIQPGHRVKRM